MILLANLIKGRHRDVVTLMRKAYKALREHDARVIQGLHTSDGVVTFPAAGAEISAAGELLDNYYKSLLAATR